MSSRDRRTERFPRTRDGRISLLVALVLVLGLAMTSLLLDVRARALSNDANERLAELKSEETRGRSGIQELMQRSPTSSREVSGGVIETYNYGGGLPGRSYTILIGYGADAALETRYLDHNLNEQQGELQLEQVLAAHQQRILHPPIEESADLVGPVEVALNDVYKGVQNGGRLVLAFDTETNTFGGRIENMTRDTIQSICVSVQLSNGQGVGPITLGDLEPGSGFHVELKTESTDFDRWTAYLENELYPNETYDAAREGVQIVLAFDAETKAFKGTAKNTTTETIDLVRIEVHLSDGSQLEPAKLDAIPPDTEVELELKTPREGFHGWSVHTTVNRL